jgi:hypothetical protein
MGSDRVEIGLSSGSPAAVPDMIGDAPEQTPLCQHTPINKNSKAPEDGVEISLSSGSPATVPDMLVGDALEQPLCHTPI